MRQHTISASIITHALIPCNLDGVLVAPLFCCKCTRSNHVVELLVTFHTLGITTVAPFLLEIGKELPATEAVAVGVVRKRAEGVVPKTTLRFLPSNLAVVG